MDDIKIESFERKYLAQVIALAESAIPHEEDGLEEIRQSFELLADWVDHALDEAMRSYVSNEMKISFRHGFNYVVALDNLGKVIGVSGAYSVNAGYLKKLGIEGCSKELEDPKNIWLGWTAVSPLFQQQGIGESLVKTAIEKTITDTEDYQDALLVVVADKGAVGFYEKKLGMQPAIIKEKISICAVKLSYLLDREVGYPS